MNFYLLFLAAFENARPLGKASLNLYTSVRLAISTPYSMVKHIIRANVCEFRTSNEENVRSYYMLTHRIRDLLSHY